MRYRLTIVTVIVGALVAAAVLLTLPSSDDSAVERDQTPTGFYSDGLGIVGALTATVDAGGPALDPTALVTPATLPETPADAALPTSTVIEGTVAAEATQRPAPVLSIAAGPVSALVSVLTGIQVP